MIARFIGTPYSCDRHTQVRLSSFYNRKACNVGNYPHAHQTPAPLVLCDRTEYESTDPSIQCSAIYRRRRESFFDPFKVCSSRLFDTILQLVGMFPSGSHCFAGSLGRGQLGNLEYGMVPVGRSSRTNRGD
jgi:hypothetical protein